MNQPWRPHVRTDRPDNAPRFDVFAPAPGRTRPAERRPDRLRAARAAFFRGDRLVRPASDGAGAPSMAPAPGIPGPESSGAAAGRGRAAGAAPLPPPGTRAA